MSAPEVSPVLAAGAVCWREFNGEVFVLAIRRARHNDISLPKGKLDPGETVPETAVREIEEETGLRIALGVPLGISTYPLAGGRSKIVHYWAAEVTDAIWDACTFIPNDEVQDLEWLGLEAARAALTYERDVEVLDRFIALRARGTTSTFAIIALRHAKAAPGSGGADSDRRLTARGQEQAQRIVSQLSAWRPRRAITSTARRCRSTVKPLAKALPIPVTKTKALSQDAWDDGLSGVEDLVHACVMARETVVLCSHSPVLPDILRETALATDTIPNGALRAAAALPTAGFTVMHLSTTDPTQGIIATESYEAAV